jgi:hypothetical protein
MLACIPPRPDYQTWLKICSAVFSFLPPDAGERVLQEWSPEERPGEYAEKYRNRCKAIGIGTLVHLAKQNGWRGHFRRRSPCSSFQKPEQPSRRRRTTPRWIASLQAPALSAPPSFSKDSRALDDEQAEAQRIAGQLVKLFDIGILTSPDDPEARFYARAISLFKGTVSDSCSE